jgi:crotonobetainyl-CoA:carnitine CoA-transferase CaiB-like acyl-CoA transferase
MQCKDGFVQIMTLLKHMWDGLVDLIGKPEWAMKEDFDNLMGKFYSGDRPSGISQEQVNKFLEEWMLQHTKEEIYHGGQARGVAVGIVSSVEDLFHSKQMKARDFFVEIEHPETGQIPYPSAPYKYSETPWRVERPAPRLGEGNARIYCERLGYSKEDLVRMRQAGVI